MLPQGRGVFGHFASCKNSGDIKKHQNIVQRNVFLKHQAMKLH